jgi:hypothetical protein
MPTTSLVKPSTPLSTLTTPTTPTANTLIKREESIVKDSEEHVKSNESSMKNRKISNLNDRKLIPLTRTSITASETTPPIVSNTSTIFFRKLNSSHANRNKQPESMLVNSKSSNELETNEKTASQNNSNKKFMTTTSLILKNARETTNQLNKSEPIVYNKYSVLEDKTKSDLNKNVDSKPEFTLYEAKRQNTPKLSNKAFNPKMQSLLVKQTPIKK